MYKFVNYLLKKKVKDKRENVRNEGMMWLLI